MLPLFNVNANLFDFSAKNTKTGDNSKTTEAASMKMDLGTAGQLPTPTDGPSTYISKIASTSETTPSVTKSSSEILTGTSN